MEIAEEAGCATLEMEAMAPASWMLEMAVAIRTPVKALSDWPLAPMMLWMRPLGPTSRRTANDRPRESTRCSSLRASLVKNFRRLNLGQAIRDIRTFEELRLDCQRGLHSSYNPTKKIR